MNIKSAVLNKWARSEPRGDAIPADQTSVGQSYDVPDEDLVTQWDGLPGDSTVYEWLQNQLRLKLNRRKNYELFEQMDDEFPELASVLDIYADNVTQVNISSDETPQERDHVVSIYSQDEKQRAFLAEIRERLKLDERTWGLTRGLAKYGDQFEEVVVSDDLKLARMKTLPVGQMIRNEDKFGVLPREDAFIELSEDLQKDVARFDDWEVLHTRLMRHNDDIYGTSILHAVRKTYKQLRMMEDAMVVARLTRASSRLVYFVDVGNLPPKLAQQHLKDVKTQHKKRRMFDSNGKMRDDANPMTVEEDIWMATRSGSPTDVKQLFGDINIGNIDDVDYFQTKLVGGVHVPKSYLQIIKDTSGKAELTQQDIQFARTVRRLQLAIRASYTKLMRLALILEGRPQDATAEKLKMFSVGLPSMQTIDELREWEMRRIQSEVARIWSQELWMEPKAVLELVLGFSEDEAKKLYSGPTEFSGAVDKNRAKAFRSAEDKKFNQKVREAVGMDGIRNLRALVEASLEKQEWDEARERGEVE